MLQSATSSEFDTFPSTAEDPYRSLQSTIATEYEVVAEQPFLAAEAELRLADGKSISAFYISASGFINDPNLLDEVYSAREDLEALKVAVDRWYDEAYRTFVEIEAAIRNPKETAVSAG